MISARAVRSITLGVCVIGIAGMIVTSALNHNGGAITFGIVTAVAILCSMVATSVAADARDRSESQDARREALAARVEHQVQGLVAAGVDEDTVRRLVGESVRLGRTIGPDRS